MTAPRSSPAAPSPVDIDGISRRTDRPDLSVIIVNYNVCDFLEQALKSVQRACQTLESEIFVVDNNSVDGSVETVRRQFPDVHLIANTENVGFSRANNQAIQKARGRYLLILNPDTIVQEDTLDTLVRFMDQHPEAGAAGCQILNPDGTFAPESRRSYPTPATAFYRMMGLSRLFPGSKRFGRYNMTYVSHEKVTEVDALSGSCMMVRHTALYFSRAKEEVLRRQGYETEDLLAVSENDDHEGAGFLDEDFFMYGEDLDWCYRIQRAGWKILYTPDTQIVHYKGESTKKGELRYVRLFYRAMTQFTRKHFSDRYSRLFALLIHTGIIIHAGLALIGRRLRSLTLPLLDFGLTYGAIVAATVWRQAQSGMTSPAYFYEFIAPLYALVTVTSIAVTDTYRRRRDRSLKRVSYGVGAAFIVVTSISYYVQAIDYSRMVPLLGFGLAAVLLVSVRWLIRYVRQLRRGLRRAVMVGHPAEAERLSHLLDRHPKPSFKLIGYVDSNQRDGTNLPISPPRLGYLHHLRDLIRLREVDDVIFAANGLSNRVIFRMMQQLRSLPVQFRILVEGREHLIGKASIDDLSTPPLVRAGETVGPLRSQWTRRMLDVTVACFGLLLHPLLLLLAVLTKGRWNRIFHQLVERTRQLPAVLRGDKTLVGDTAAHSNRLPGEWNVPAGVFSIIEAFAVPPEDRTEIQRAYWFYARNQSLSMDTAIVYRALRLMVTTTR